MAAEAAAAGHLPPGRLPDTVNAAPFSSAPLGILSGSGDLPLAVARAAHAAGRPVFALSLAGLAPPGMASFPHARVEWGQVGAMIRLLRRAGCRDMVIAGAVTRPNLRQLRPDLGLIANLPRILALTRGGDDSVLARVVQFFEAKGFRVLGAHEIAPGLVARGGALGRHAPDAVALADIARGAGVVAALGALDVGQSAVVARGHVLAVEAAEGTDAMLERCAALRQWGGQARAGVLVKAPKPGQELRVDMPAVGPETVRRVAAAGLAGLALAEGAVLMVQREATIAAADAAGLFIATFATAPQADERAAP